jgi:hypothetical protein
MHRSQVARRTPSQRAQDRRDRAKMVREGINVAVPTTVLFQAAFCRCGRVLLLDNRSFIHLDTGTVEC